MCGVPWTQFDSKLDRQDCFNTIAHPPAKHQPIVQALNAVVGTVVNSMDRVRFLDIFVRQVYAAIEVGEEPPFTFMCTHTQRHAHTHSHPPTHTHSSE